MKDSHKSPMWWSLFPIGIMWMVFTLDAPIHEMCHAVAVVLTGGRVTRIEWAYIYWRGGLEGVIRFFGYGGEMILFAALTMVSTRMAPFWLGALSVTIFFVPNSGDFYPLGTHAKIIAGVLWFTLLIFAVAVTYARRASGRAERSAEPHERA